MGAADFPAGFSPAGFDPISLPPEEAPSAEPRALLFDLSARQFVRNADGTLATVHPVDAEVAIAFGFVLGSIPASPADGLDVQRVRHTSKSNALRITTDAVAVALARLISAGDITLLSVTVSTPVRGALGAVLSYVNNRLASPTTLTLR